MSRWIDADAVIARIAGQMSYEIEVETGNETDCVDLAEELLNDIPSIDIVRCRECKYFEPKDWCYWRDEMITADDFCSYGQKGDENVETD